MLKKLNCYVIKVGIFLITAALVAGMAGCDGDGYTPPPTPSLEIRTWYDLDAVRGNLTGSYILMNDLDSTTPGYDELASPTANQGKGWEPIGWGYWVWTWFGVKELGEIFKGSFDGQGYEIRDLYINSEGLVGLFGFVAKGGIITEGGSIKNITLINATVTTGEAARGPLGLNEDTVRCLDVGTVDAVGGLVGYNGGTVSNSYFTGNVTGVGNVGGLVGRNDGTVSNCYAMGNVTGDWNVGGLVGENYDATVIKCYSTGSVTGTSSVGGLVGENYEGAVRDSYSIASVTGYSEVGGLVGDNEGTVRNSYSVGSVTGTSSLGGLVGYNDDGTVSNSFWDMETSGQATSDGGTGKTTAELKNIGTFTGAGWNIIVVAPGSTNTTYIWNIFDDETYPFLSWQPA